MTNSTPQPPFSTKQATEVLIRNSLHFMQILRMAGINTGLDNDIAAVRSLALTAPRTRQEWRSALQAICVRNREEIEIFNQAFGFFWQGGIPDHDLRMQEQLGVRQRRLRQGYSRRVLEAFFGDVNATPLQQQQPEAVPGPSWSQREVVANKDFTAMSRAEFAQALRLINELRWVMPRQRQRRMQQHNGHKPNWRRMLQVMARDPERSEIYRHGARTKEWPLIILLDVSGSMEIYSRVFLLYMHCLVKSLSLSVEIFIFSTELVRITRAFRDNSADRAIEQLGKRIDFWSGGTCIGTCLQKFVQQYSKRLLYHRSILVVASDGLDRGDLTEMQQALTQIKRSNCQLLWLNPLFRYQDYQALAGGARILDRYSDVQASMHNVAALAQLHTKFIQAANRC